MSRIDAFLDMGRQQGCSDIHFTVGRPPLIRLDGELLPVKYRELTAAELDGFIDEILGEEGRAQLETLGSVDFAYSAPGVGRFRVNVARQFGGLRVVCRVIAETVPCLTDLGLPEALGELTRIGAGLLLVTGSAGTGKSTTLAALVNEINRRENRLILTLEDPIEILHASQSSLVVQREIGPHASSFAEGLRGALRQDPDVILIGEIRDRETMSLALEAAETGHLVLGTLHTRNASKTIDRILDSFPHDQHEQVRMTLAEHLRCVISQELVRAADGRGRRAAVELMLMSSAIAQHIREGNTHLIPDAIGTGRRLGMQLMDQALLRLVQAGEVDPEDAYRHSLNKSEFESYRPPDEVEAA